MMKTARTTLWLSTGLVGLCALVAAPATADQQILDDLIVDGSACIGQDCVNGESFGFDTIRIKENNLRIRAVDTSNSASFPTNDWQITFNDSSNGGQNKFSIDDIDGGRVPFTIEAGAPSHSLYVDDGGRIGLGTSTPVVEVHVKDGDTPTVRLEQDGSSGFTPQTWDLAGNETNFFIRDASNGSLLSFRIRPNAPSNSIYVDTDGDIGMGTSSVDDELHIERSGNDDVIVKLESTSGTTQNTGVQMVNNLSTWNMLNNTVGNLRFSVGAGGIGTVMELNALTGDLTLALGDCSDVAANGIGCTPDYVFEPDYELMSLDALAAFIAENKHLPNVPSAAENAANGIGVRKLNFAMLEKIEELVLYTLEQQETIDSLTARLEALERAE